MSASLLQFQQDVTARLQSDSYFVDIPVFLIREKRLESEINLAVNFMSPVGSGTKRGVGVLVLMPTASDPKENVPGPFLEMAIIVRVHENPTVNMADQGIQKSAEEVALQVLSVLHHFQPVGVCGALFASRNALVPSLAFEPLVTYDVKVQALFPQANPSRAAMPTITNNANTITLATGTAGASIYYSLDASFPWSGSGLLYTVPFVIVPPKTVRAAAYKSGMQGSNVNQLVT